MTGFRLTARYTRDDPRGIFPRREGVQELDGNRLALFWRPMIDMTDSDLAPMRLRFVAPVADWIADPVPGRRLWFSRIGVPGLRSQVLRHAGLTSWDCRQPTELPAELRTERWTQLLEAVGRYDELDDSVRTAVVFQLAQLSFAQFAADLAGVVMPTGDPTHDWYAYEAARVTARYPEYAERAAPVFRALAERSSDPLLVSSACLQGIGRAVRRAGDFAAARWFEQRGSELMLPDDDWHSALVASRFHRATALLRLREKRADEAGWELKRASELNDEVAATPRQGTDVWVADENQRIILETTLKATGAGILGDDAHDVPRLAEALHQLDPTCVEALLVIGDAYAHTGDLERAAAWYVSAGRLETVSGATAWFRAGQCYDRLGHRADAADAMAQCLELDRAAVEPREYLRTHGASAA